MRGISTHLNHLVHGTRIDAAHASFLNAADVAVLVDPHHHASHHACLFIHCRIHNVPTADLHKISYGHHVLTLGPQRQDTLNRALLRNIALGKVPGWAWEQSANISWAQVVGVRPRRDSPTSPCHGLGGWGGLGGFYAEYWAMCTK